MNEPMCSMNVRDPRLSITIRPSQLHIFHLPYRSSESLFLPQMLFTWDTTNLCIVFRQWRITGTWSLIWSLVAIALLTAGYEAVREVARRYEAGAGIGGGLVGFGRSRSDDGLGKSDFILFLLWPLEYHDFRRLPTFIFLSTFYSF